MHTGGKGSHSSYSPSFNSYYNTGLAVIAARVTTEFPEDDEFAQLENNDNGAVDGESDDLEDQEFEFDLSNLVPGDGEIRPVYPVFNRDLLMDLDPVAEKEDLSKATTQLERLSLDVDPPSSSSSEADEMEEVPPGTYSVWAPVATPSPGRCTKSNSTGSSSSAVTGKVKSWKLREFLKRSKSDGKEGLMAVRGRPPKSTAVPERYYGGGETKRKSYLPYRQDLVGFFATPHAFRKMNLPPF